MDTKQQAGFSLLEILVYISLIVVISTIFIGFIQNIVRESKNATAIREVYADSRFILLKINQDIKTAKQIIATSTTSISFKNIDNTTVNYHYDSSAKSVVYNNGVDNKLSGDKIKITQFQIIYQGKVITIAFTVESNYIDIRSGKPHSLVTSTAIVPRINLF